MKRYNDKDSFVKLSNYLHNNKYNYENFVYKGKNIVGEIICPIHGSFYQTPSIHTRAKRPSGCPECAKSNKKIKFETFIERAKKIHGDNYIYDKNDFIDISTKMRIFCKKHNTYFVQTPKNHVHKTNPTKCPLCSAENVIIKNRDTFDDFLKKAKIIHGEHYLYDKESYVNSTTKMKIFCKKCNKWFKQKPHTHLSGSGCPKCKKSKMEEKVMCELEKYKIKYNYQHSFEWLIFKRKQYLDFYLPDYNVAIECQGEQHFKPIDFSHNNNKKDALKRYNLNQLRDENKRKLCIEHNIKLFYICYNDDFAKKMHLLLEENKII